MIEEKKPVSKAQQRSVNKYVKENYDRINVTFPKGQRAIIKSFADVAGLSVNAYITKAVNAAMNGSQPSESPVSVSTPLVVSDDIARVNAHIEVTGEDTGEFIHRAIGDTIDRDAALLKMGISPAKKKSGE